MTLCNKCMKRKVCKHNAYVINNPEIEIGKCSEYIENNSISVQKNVVPVQQNIDRIALASRIEKLKESKDKVSCETCSALVEKEDIATCECGKKVCSNCYSINMNLESEDVYKCSDCYMEEDDVNHTTQYDPFDLSEYKLMFEESQKDEPTK